MIRSNGYKILYGLWKVEIFHMKYAVFPPFITAFPYYILIFVLISGHPLNS